MGSQLILCPGGRAILEDEQGHVLLMKRSDFGLWGLPSGSPEVGESAEASILIPNHRRTLDKFLEFKRTGKFQLH